LFTQYSRIMAALEQQHPIPQQISSYQFRLVGDMTLKQFFQVAGGALISLLIYASSLPGYIKWPAIIFFSLSGVALAFLPFEERPLQQWIFSFFKSVYSPTLFFWKKSEKPPVFFKEEAPVPEEKVVAPHGEAAMEKYLESLPGRGTSVSSKLEDAEKSFFTRLSYLFKPTPKTVEKLSPEPSAKEKEEVQLTIPKTAPTPIAPPSFKPKMIVEERTVKQVVQPQPQKVTFPVVPIPVARDQITGREAQFSPDAAPPIPPEKPNTVTGQVMDTAGKIVEGAILEIKDVSGRPVRAVKTNKVGHFAIVTPLQNGRYEIITEKEGLDFDSVTFEATGVIIPPIAIKSKNKQ